MGHITIFKFKQGMQITKKSDLTNMFRLHHSERHLCDQYHPVHIPVHIAVTTCVNSKQTAYSSYRPYSTHWRRKLRRKIEIVESNHESGLWRWNNSITNGDTDLKEVQVVVLRRVGWVRQPETIMSLATLDRKRYTNETAISRGYVSCKRMRLFYASIFAQEHVHDR